MKAVTSTLKQIAVDGVYFLAAITLTIAGFWGMIEIEASLFSMVVFGLLMVPSVFSTTVFLSRDINDTFIA
ncbi:MAG: hypothetical protein CSA49_02090 [Gammaproteobacteria bacterium]|nr:MAG: hypothetical protein CSA49_02090 [Gammaproteobacteria bacterium]